MEAPNSELNFRKWKSKEFDERYSVLSWKTALLQTKKLYLHLIYFFMFKGAKQSFIKDH